MSNNHIEEKSIPLADWITQGKVYLSLGWKVVGMLWGCEIVLIEKGGP